MKNLRLEKVMEVLEQNGKVSVKELSDLFGVSDITVHRTLTELEEKGLLRRVRGGAILIQSQPEFQYPNRVNSSLKEKNAIAQKVSELIRPGDTIIMDGSTTNIHIASKLKNIANLTVFTMSPYVMLELLDAPDVFLYSMGGLYSKEMAHFIGSSLEKSITEATYDKCIIGASAISCEKGITGPHPQIVSIQRKIIKSSKKVILAADHTKYGRVAVEKVAEIEQIDY